MKNILTNFVIAQGPINNNQYTHFAHKKKARPLTTLTCILQRVQRPIFVHPVLAR